jgi:transposase
VHERDAEQRQVDLPPMRPVVTRFRVGIGRCAGCGRRVQDRHPDQASDALGAAGSQVGPVAKAWSLWRHYELGLSFGKCARLLRRLGIEVTAGALSQAAQATGTALVPAHQDLVARATGSDVVVVDETGWRIGGSSAWLWVATNEHLTVYNVADRRGFDQACDLVDADYAGTIVRDGRAPYRRYDQASHQTCVAHLLRRCHHLIEDRPAWARGTPRQVAAILHEALAAGDLDDARRAEVAADLPERVELLTGQPQPDDECRKLIAPVRWSRFTVVLDAPQSYHDVSRSSPCGSFHSLRMKWQV